MSDVSAKPKNPRRDWPAIFENWKRSGISQAAFCTARCIPIASFSGALHRARRAEPDSPQGFARVRIPRSNAAIVVDLPRGVRITLSSLDVVDLVRRLSSDV
ncbi:hypothetical protein BH10ACI3_BH10ACI3_30190 [soil metagenome]